MLQSEIEWYPSNLQLVSSSLHKKQKILAGHIFVSIWSLFYSHFESKKIVFNILFSFKKQINKQRQNE